MSSAWNQLSGNWMWEERNFSKQAKSRYPELFSDVICENCSSCFPGYTATGTMKIQGEIECSVLVLHGRLRFGLDIDDVRIDVKIMKDDEIVFDGVVSIDNVSTDEGIEAIEKTSVHIRETHKSSNSDANKIACNSIQKALASSAIKLRDEIINKSSSSSSSSH